MAKHDETNTLRKVLERVGIPDSYYSIGEYKEGAVCIEENEEGYVVYDAERAEKNEKKEYKLFGVAAYDIVSRIAMTKADEKYLQNEIFDEIMKEALTEVFELNDIPHFYSLEGYAEEAVCMEKDGKKYIVYDGERGNKYNIKKYRRIGIAFRDIISRVTESDEQEEKVTKDFTNKLKTEL